MFLFLELLLFARVCVSKVGTRAPDKVQEVCGRLKNVAAIGGTYAQKSKKSQMTS